MLRNGIIFQLRLCKDFLTRYDWKKVSSVTPVKTMVRFCDSGKTQTLSVRETRYHAKSQRPWMPDAHGHHSGDQRRPIPWALTLSPLPKSCKWSAFSFLFTQMLLRKLRGPEVCKGLLQLFLALFSTVRLHHIYIGTSHMVSYTNLHESVRGTCSLDGHIPHLLRVSSCFFSFTSAWVEWLRAVIVFPQCPYLEIRLERHLEFWHNQDLCYHKNLLWVPGLKGAQLEQN